MHPYFLTILAMLAFAANSVLCRMALGEGAIDAASFTTIRLLSGSIILGIILWSRSGKPQVRNLDPVAMAMLFLYAICFSFAYIDLGAGTGALVLFGMVQLTMIVFGLFSGERPAALAWLGMAIAAAGLVYLILPGVSAPSLKGVLLMSLAGIAWGIYSLRGRGINSPVNATAWNFIGTIPLTLIASAVFFDEIHITANGLILAVSSGALASGLGYVIWYAALPHLTPTRAATVQLSVPVIAAFGGVLLLSEPVTTRLLLSSVVVLGGIAVVIWIRGSSKKID